MSRDEATRWAAMQDAYIADQDMILIGGNIGPDPDFRTGARLYIDRRNANIPGMQQQLYFPRGDDFTPEFTIIFTPHLTHEDMPNGCLITVDLDNWVTRVFGSDYFGESKMAGLRMWNHLVYSRGGLAMHSGAKTFPSEATPDGHDRLALIIGLSGTGKTTTTFRNVLGSLPVQDDFVALMPDGTVHTTENGCFAKTIGLDPDNEPTIHRGASSPQAWLESTHVEPDGTVDFFDASYTANGRCTFGLDMIRHCEPRDLPKAHYLFILNRNADITPAVAKLEPHQAAKYFMLGETRGTSAGGASEGQETAGTGHQIPPGSRRTRRRAIACFNTQLRSRRGLSTGSSNGRSTPTSGTSSQPRSRASTTTNCCSHDGCTSVRGVAPSTSESSLNSWPNDASTWQHSPTSMNRSSIQPQPGPRERTNLLTLSERLTLC